MPHIIRKVQDTNPTQITCGIMRRLTDASNFHNLDIIHVTITDSTKRHYHKTLTEVYFVLKGSIVVEVDGEREPLEENQMLLILPNTNHKAWKTSKEDAELLVMCSPPWSEEDEILV